MYFLLVALSLVVFISEFYRLQGLISEMICYIIKSYLYRLGLANLAVCECGLQKAMNHIVDVPH